MRYPLCYTLICCLNVLLWETEMEHTAQCKKKTLMLILIALTLAFIWGNSCLSRETSSEMSGFTVSILSFLNITDDAFVRKAAHFTEYFALGAELSVLLRICGKKGSRVITDVIIFGLLVGFFDETIQIFSGRAPEIADVWLDWAGYNTGFWIFRGVSKRKQSRLAADT